MGRTATLVCALWLALATVAWAENGTYYDLPRAVPEGATTYPTFTVTDHNGTLTTPHDVVFWVGEDLVEFPQRTYGPITCCATGASGCSATSGACLSALASTNTLWLPPLAHRIVDPSKAIETHVITAVFRYPSTCVPTVTDPTDGTYCNWSVSRARYPLVNLNVIVPVSGTPPLGPTPAPTPSVTP